MQKATRRVWSILLVCFMLLTMLPAGAWAADEDVAEIKEVKTAADLIEAFKTSGEIQLANDVTITNKDLPYSFLLLSANVSVTLDLNQHTLTMQNSNFVMDTNIPMENSYGYYVVNASMVNAGSLTVKNGTIKGEAANSRLIINRETGTLFLKDDVNLENSYSNAIDNLGGSVTSSADITVPNTSSAKLAAIVTYGGSVTINGGTIEADNGLDIYNRFYTNTSDGATVTVNGGTISAQVYALNTNNLYSGGDTPSNAVINGGKLSSSRGSAIYWPSAGTLTIGTEGGDDAAISVSSPAGSAIEVCSGMLEINSGTFAGSDSNAQKNDSATWAAEYRKNPGCAGLGDAVTVIARRGSGYATAPLSVTINGGTFESSDNYAVRYFDCNQVKGAQQIEQEVEFSIAGGRFTGPQGADAIDAQMMAETEKPFISGGLFSENMDMNLVENGYALISSGNADYPYEVKRPDQVEEGEADYILDNVTTSVDDSQISDLNLNEEDQKNVINAAESVTVSSNTMQEESKTTLEEAKNNAATLEETAVEELEKLSKEENIAASDITLFVQTYFTIMPTEYAPEQKTLELEITPVSRIVASTQADSSALVLEGEAEEGETPNAVVVQEEKEISIQTPSEITVVLPSIFQNETVYVKHEARSEKVYYYHGNADETGELTFTSYHGFSPFTFSLENGAAAEIDDIGYESLQQAVDDVQEDGFIVAKKSDSASVSQSVSFTVSAENDAVASISAGRGYRMTKVENEDGTITYTFRKRSGSSSNSGSTGGIGTRLPMADEDSTPAVTGFESDTNADLTVNGRYQFRITSLDSHTPVLTVNNANFTVTLASRSGNDYFYVITCAGTPGSTAAVSVDGKYLLTATVGGSASGVDSDTTHPFTVAQGGTYQFRLTAAARPSFAAGSASFTVEYAGQEGNDWFYKVHAVGQIGDSCGFYINGEAQPVAVATIA